MAQTRVSAKQRRAEVLAQFANLPQKENLKYYDYKTLQTVIEWADDFKAAAQKFIEAKKEAAEALEKAKAEYNKQAKLLGLETI